jgi:hypothetical protein
MMKEITYESTQELLSEDGKRKLIITRTYPSLSLSITKAFFDSVSREYCFKDFPDVKAEKLKDLIDWLIEGK